MSHLSPRKRLKYQILRFLLDREHGGPALPAITEIARHLGLPDQEVSDQLDILDAEGAIRANRSIDGGAAPMLTGSGKGMLEDLKEEVEGSDAVYERQERNDTAPSLPDFEWDAFISHASEDKDPFVRQLAKELEDQGVRVWFDDFELKVGDSLRHSIDRGLARSQYGIVVLSKSFFQKHWPQRELDGLAAREREEVKVILPVWLNIGKEDVVQQSPLLADLIAVRASRGMYEVVRELLRVINPDLGMEERTGNREAEAGRLYTEERVQSTGEPEELKPTSSGWTAIPPEGLDDLEIRRAGGSAASDYSYGITTIDVRAPKAIFNISAVTWHPQVYVSPLKQVPQIGSGQKQQLSLRVQWATVTEPAQEVQDSYQRRFPLHRPRDPGPPWAPLYITFETQSERHWAAVAYMRVERQQHGHPETQLLDGPNPFGWVKGQSGKG